MSFADDATELERSFRSTHELLRQLLQGLQARRAAWVSARPSTLQPSPELERLTQEIAREETQRDELLRRLGTALPAPPGAPPSSLHVNVTRVAAALPRAASASLREAANAATSLAKAVRAEVSLGQRLVRFARNADDARSPAASTRREPPGYDRRARVVLGAKVAGALIDGKA